MAVGAIMGQQKANPQLSNLSNNQQALYNIGAGTRLNLLDNWCFIGGGGRGQLPINQRGENFYTADGAYTIDRWKLVSPSQSLTLSVQSSGINLHKTLQRGDTGFYQVLGNQDNVGKTVTVSILYSGTGLSDVSLDSPGLANGNIFQDSTTMTLTSATYELGTGSVGTISNSAYVGIKLGSSMSTFNTLTIYAIKLEIGETQTLAYQDLAGGWNLLSQPENDYLVQLLKCQQYYIQYKTSGTAVIGNAQGVNSTIAVAALPLPTQMRIIPSIEAENDTVILRSGLSDIEATLTNVYNMQNNTLYLEFTASNSLEPGKYYIIRLTDSTGIGIALSADL